MGLIYFSLLPSAQLLQLLVYLLSLLHTSDTVESGQYPGGDTIMARMNKEKTKLNNVQNSHIHF